jgi:hypothetical protein
MSMTGSRGQLCESWIPNRSMAFSIEDASMGGGFELGISAGKRAEGEGISPPTTVRMIENNSSIHLPPDQFIDQDFGNTI